MKPGFQFILECPGFYFKDSHLNKISTLTKISYTLVVTIDKKNRLLYYIGIFNKEEWLVFSC